MAAFDPFLPLADVRAKMRALGYGVRGDFELNFGRYLTQFGPAEGETATDTAEAEMRLELQP